MMKNKLKQLISEKKELKSYLRDHQEEKILNEIAMIGLQPLGDAYQLGEQEEGMPEEPADAGGLDPSEGGVSLSSMIGLSRDFYSQLLSATNNNLELAKRVVDLLDIRVKIASDLQTGKTKDQKNRENFSKTSKQIERT